jgi:hypothetical protein
LYRSIVKVALRWILTPAGITYPVFIGGLKKTSLTGILITNPGSPGPIHPVVGIGIF